MTDCAKYVYRNEGLSAFYVSYPTTLSMTVPFTALQFLAYESISTAMNPTKAYDPLTHCAAGGVAGGFAAALTTPMDVVKTMLQTRGTATDTELRNVNGFMEGSRLLYRREGFRGFFKGVRPRVVTTMPSTAATIPRPGKASEARCNRAGTTFPPRDASPSRRRA